MSFIKLEFMAGLPLGNLLHQKPLHKYAQFPVMNTKPGSLHDRQKGPVVYSTWMHVWKKKSKATFNPQYLLLTAK